MKSGVLIIYTGGTIGMEVDPFSGALTPLDFHHLEEHIPELGKFNLNIDSISFDVPIDSSNITPHDWKKIARQIESNYSKYDGFVVLHGSDTMAYTASALSFMLYGLTKPVILSGSQLPIGQIRTDGKENLITAIEIAGAKNEDGSAKIPEVAVFFEDELYRGNRTHKNSTEYFDAFNSPNYPILAKAGVSIKYKSNYIHKPFDVKFEVLTKMGEDLQVLHIYPGISANSVESILATPKLKVLIMLTFGAGNAPTADWFIKLLDEAIQKGIVIFNISQCDTGTVQQGKYSTSSKLKKIGVTGGSDILIEAAITKTMHLLGKNLEPNELRFALSRSLKGEMT
jgi:L-asparaginase